MDILISSNFERFLFEVSGRDAARTAEWFKSLFVNVTFAVDSRMLALCRENMHAGWASEKDVQATIAEYYAQYGYVLDPHTAVGVKVYEDYRRESGDTSYTVVASTASPFKFAQSVLQAIQQDEKAGEDPWEALAQLSRLSGWKIPKGLMNLQEKPAQPVYRCRPDQIEDYIREKFCNTKMQKSIDISKKIKVK
jgi:threonine synthase